MVLDKYHIAIRLMKEYHLSSKGCRKRAEKHFDKDKCFERYIDLSKKMLNADIKFNIWIKRNVF